MGEHMKAAANVVDIHHAPTINIRIIAVTRKARVTKMRYKRMRMDIFAEASTQGWSTEAE